MADIKDDRVLARIVAAVARKKSGWMTKTFRAVSNKGSPNEKK